MKIKTLHILLFLCFTIFSACLEEEILIGTAVENHFFLENDGARMMVRVEGNTSSKTFLVILHGGPGGEAAVYNLLATAFSEPLERDYAVVYWDQRGSGNSSGNYSQEELNVQQYVEDLDKLLTLLQHRYGADIGLFLMGHSWGGALASAYVTTGNKQEKLKGWCNVDGVHNFPAMRKWVLEKFLEFAPTQIAANNSKEEWEDILEYCQDLNPNNITDEEELRLNSMGYQAEQLLTSDGIVNLPEYDISGLLEYSLTSYHNTNMALVSRILTSSQLWDKLRDLNYTEAMEQVTIPALFMWGEHDFVVPPKMGEEIFEHYGGEEKEIHFFSKSGHSPMINEANEFVSILKNFIETYK